MTSLGQLATPKIGRLLSACIVFSVLHSLSFHSHKNPKNNDYDTIILCKETDIHRL